MNETCNVHNFEDPFQGLNLQPLKSVTLSADKEKLTFEFEGGGVAIFGVEGDCCSKSWIEHIDVPPYVMGEKIISITENVKDGTPQQLAKLSEDGDVYEDVYDDALAIYTTRFNTLKGCITLEYRNLYNGYHGGSLVRIQ